MIKTDKASLTAGLYQYVLLWLPHKPFRMAN